MRSVMVDIESFGIGRDAAIASIGAVIFDPFVGKIGSVRFRTREEMKNEVPLTGNDLPPVGLHFESTPVKIGEVRADVDAGTIYEGFHVRIDLSKSLHPGVLNASTVEWWLKQPKESQEKLLVEPREELGTALLRFKEFAEGADELWSNGPTFDEMILRDAFARYGFVNFPVSFRASRCCRTLVSLAKAKGYQFPKSERTDKHDALGDAIYQAKGVISIYEFLGIKKS